MQRTNLYDGIVAVAVGAGEPIDVRAARELSFALSARRVAGTGTLRVDIESAAPARFDDDHEWAPLRARVLELGPGGGFARETVRLASRTALVRIAWKITGDSTFALRASAGIP